MQQFCLVFFFLFLSLTAECFDKVVIWGHKLHSHTHSYIHERFYRAFQYLGYPTYWFDDSDKLKGFDFSNTLFLTEGQVDKRIPIREDCYYMLHNCDGRKYQSLFASGHCITFQVYTDRALLVPNLIKEDTCIYYDVPGKCVYMPWASDLLPHEIDEMKKKLPIEKKKEIHWIGTIGDGTFGNIHQLNPFKQACRENGISFIPQRPGLAENLSRKMISTSYLAPAIVGKWQEQEGYIPCRIFIAISQGQMGVTNSLRVSELFDGKIVYNHDTYQLFYDAKERLRTWTLEDQYVLMDVIKTKHTYLNRIQTLLHLFDLIHAANN